MDMAREHSRLEDICPILTNATRCDPSHHRTLENLKRQFDRLKFSIADEYLAVTGYRTLNWNLGDIEQAREELISVCRSLDMNPHVHEARLDCMCKFAEDQMARQKQPSIVSSNPFAPTDEELPTMKPSLGRRVSLPRSHRPLPPPVQPEFRRLPGRRPPIRVDSRTSPWVHEPCPVQARSFSSIPSPPCDSSQSYPVRARSFHTQPSDLFQLEAPHATHQVRPINSLGVPRQSSPPYRQPSPTPTPSLPYDLSQLSSVLPRVVHPKPISRFHSDTSYTPHHDTPDHVYGAPQVTPVAHRPPRTSPVHTDPFTEIKRVPPQLSGQGSVSNLPQRIWANESRFFRTVGLTIDGVKARGMFDEGSDLTFVSQDFVRKCGLVTRKAPRRQVNRFASSTPITLDTMVEIELGDLNFSYRTIITCYVSPCNLDGTVPSANVDVIRKLLEEDVVLNDPEEAAPIDILIGNDFGVTFMESWRKVTPTLAIQGTKFGWVVHGSVPTEAVERSSITMCVGTGGQETPPLPGLATVDPITPLTEDQRWTTPLYPFYSCRPFILVGTPKISCHIVCLLYLFLSSSLILDVGKDCRGVLGSNSMAQTASPFPINNLRAKPRNPSIYHCSYHQIPFNERSFTHTVKQEQYHIILVECDRSGSLCNESLSRLHVPWPFDKGVMPKTRPMLPRLDKCNYDFRMGDQLGDGFERDRILSANGWSSWPEKTVRWGVVVTSAAVSGQATRSELLEVFRFKDPGSDCWYDFAEKCKWRSWLPSIISRNIITKIQECNIEDHQKPFDWMGQDMIENMIGRTNRNTPSGLHPHSSSPAYDYHEGIWWQLGHTEDPWSRSGVETVTSRPLYRTSSGTLAVSGGWAVCCQTATVASSGH